MKIYISGPITNDKDYKEKFAKAEFELKAQGYEVVNPTVLDPLNLDYEELMDLDFRLIDICDAMVMLKGWQQSCGANREYGYALAKDLIILELDSVLKKEKASSNDWILASERLPNEEERRKAYCRSVDESEFIVMIEGATLPTALYIGINNDIWFDDEHNQYKVTHWQPMPAPPESHSGEMKGE